MNRVSKMTCAGFCCLALLLPVSALAVDIDQTRGADQKVDYRSLTQYGPWDDRNYQLRSSDLALLADNEAQLKQPIPAFFRVEMRREFPNLPRTGRPQYPRSSVPLFLRRYGGLMQDGVIKDDRSAPPMSAKDLQAIRSDVTVNLEQEVSSPNGDGNESTVEINPVNPDLVIGGANVNAGQEMYYSQDGGTTWFISTVLPDTCCDPVVEWSVDGTVAHVAALGGNTSIDTWRSLDGGQTWIDHLEHEGGGRDKEWLHVDHFPTSPHYGNLYLVWHDGNVQKFRRNTNPHGELSGWQPIISFNSQPRGIGSDVTTDHLGNIYYFYGNTDDSEIGVLRSSDGGATFAPYKTVATTNGNFDFPIPSMALRNAWIYTAAGTDLSGGPHHGRVYVSWTDINLPVETDPVNNHTQIHVAYSDDQGDTWTEAPFPHDAGDVLTVDRWNQWVDVDENGVVHAAFYDTRNSASREGVDYYYNYSIDGAASWHGASRISSVTSTTPSTLDLQQFGDYNGISAVGSSVIFTWTDNRTTGPLDSKDIWMADANHPAANANFILGATNLSQAVCSPGDLDTMAVNVGAVSGFSSPVTLAYGSMPAGFSGVFSANPVTPGSSSDADVSVTAASGNYTFEITGSATGVDDKSLTANVAVAGSAPGSTTLTSPADGSPDQPPTPELVWTATAEATSYLVEIDNDPTFASIDYSESTTATSHQVATGLTPDTWYWRVTPNNPCGSGTASAAFGFSVEATLCSAPGAAIPDGSGSLSDTLVIGAAGTITDLNVSLDISHSWVGDLTITLTHAGTGTSITLIQELAAGQCQFNDILAVMDDEAILPVTTNGCGTGAPSVNGEFQPEVGNFLSDFDGELIAGAWTLELSDAVAQDAGTLNEWCLEPQLDLPPPPDTDGDGIIDDDDNCPNTFNSGQEDGDGDNVGDVCDNCLLEPNEDQCNTNAHEDDFGNVCDADLDNNGIVNSFDLTILRENIGASGANDADITCNGIVNTFDLTELRNDIGNAPGPTGL